MQLRGQETGVESLMWHFLQSPRDARLRAGTLGVSRFLGSDGVGPDLGLGSVCTVRLLGRWPSGLVRAKGYLLALSPGSVTLRFCVLWFSYWPVLVAELLAGI